ncbi:MAG: nucleoside triphosphate pyrophosphohydrolase family protein [Candidatus Thiodiazotropha taylori]|uniref:Nucleoside triphosphate pyrophosphohydrolase family protein n=1 Tax=Candidatus Thiodiazotropha taylori TaxID=2792791 RepID=A0A9E4N2M9_9GAMM|nr:nucleoside triphosphate pyrophosphohydrolase family protein [Candidatus Thiodiazotropha taylori]MCW4255083.1 nucleoside triphosphate pyrophosphohydrolase family protein [Candidatus Thiodiazotropha taylori]
MSDFPLDMYQMHLKFGVRDWVEKATPDQKKELMKLRMRMLTEEFAETMNAYLQGDEEEMIDGLIDLCVIAIGTLDIANVDPNHAWDEIYRANTSKDVGVKPNRPNPLGLPDLIKPEGWKGPDHSDNHGNLKEFL